MSTIVKGVAGRLGVGLLLAAWVVVAAGCGVVSGDRLVTRSTGRSVELTPKVRVVVYRATDRSTADIYLTDLPEGAPEADWTTLEGTLVHLHVFIRPRAGRTPIADSACSFTLRQFVMARGQVGMYGGGGFFLPKEAIGSEELRVEFSGATLRLNASTPGFEDLLGPSTMDASWTASRDDAGAARWARLAGKLAEQASRGGTGAAQAPAGGGAGFSR